MQINAIDYFEKGALLKSGDKLAIKDQNRAVTFAELGRFAKNCAALILKKSTGYNQPIPVFLPKSAENIIADLGILYSGNAYANFDIKSPPQRLKGMLDNLNPAIIVTSAANAPALRALEIAEDRLLLIEQAMQRRLPTMFNLREFVQDGGLMS
jgi:non-ribosomal peptide synthetase component F